MQTATTTLFYSHHVIHTYQKRGRNRKYRFRPRFVGNYFFRWLHLFVADTFAIGNGFGWAARGFLTKFLLSSA